MRLCLACALIETHASGCPRAPQAPQDPAAATRAAMAEAESRLEKVAEFSPAEGILLLQSALELLELRSARDLPTFDAKRAHNELISRIKRRRSDLETNISASGALLSEEYGFAKQALSRFLDLQLRRAEARAYDVSALEKLPLSSIPVADRSLSDIGAEVERRLDESKNLDVEVARWGWKNLRPLMLAREPAEIPPELAGGGVGSYLGALVGKGPSTRRVAATTRFKLLGKQYRERLYLLGANPPVLRVTSRLLQAEDAWKKLLGRDDGATRWSRLKEENRVVIAFFLDDELAGARDLESALASAAAESPAAVRRALRPFDAVEPDEWDIMAKAYMLVFASIMGGGSSRDVGLETVAPAILQMTNGERADAVTRMQAFQSIRDVWHARPPRELKDDAP